MPATELTPPAASTGDSYALALPMATTSAASQPAGTNSETELATPTTTLQQTTVTLRVSKGSSNAGEFVTVVTSMVPVILTTTRIGQDASAVESASLALPTIFTPYPSCTVGKYTLAPSGVDNTTLMGTELTAAHGLQALCFPSWNVYSSNGSLTTQPQTSYTPATCFDGYTAAISYVSDATTTATCCPSGWQASSSDCFATHLKPAPVVIISSSSTTTTRAALERAPWHVVAWQSQDRSLWDANYRPTTNNTGGVSNAAKGGIGAGVAVLVLIIAFTVGSFILKRRRQRKAKAESEDLSQKAELPGDGKQLPELGNETALHETDGAGKLPEVDARETVRSELESDWTGWEAPALLEVELSRPETDVNASGNDLLRLAKNTKRKDDGQEEEQAERGVSSPRDHP